MRGQKQPPTPEQIAQYARVALHIEDMAMDAGSGTCYLLCKMSHLEIKPVVVAVDSAKLASMAITFIQVAQAVRDAAARMAAGIQQ